MSKSCFNHTYEDIISPENLLAAWREFLKGKRSKQDVREFQYKLFDNMVALHEELKSKTYVHGGYYAFNISDPKPRNIHKALVRDRLLHHALYRKLYPFFDKTFIAHSYSCRKYKGTHRAIKAFQKYFAKASCNNTKTLWVLKCDIRKFFASVDQKILYKILDRRIPDTDILCLVRRVVESFHSTAPGKGLPLGNLTSQLLVNIYMNEFDQFVKHKLKVKYYIRYADDFVFLSCDKKWLEDMLVQVRDFLWNELRLTLHPNKVSIETISSGVDFLGWVHFPDHRVLRTSTKRRMFKCTHGLEGDSPTVQSYIGLLRHGNAYKLEQKLPKTQA
ncbi:MAG: reverse transcriptase/maturase family protein [Candidatus Adlerbacteria bacterium]|nr:reverse transcriptase/maturase family protein [Candidatus Adlerbacteria bacterium]